MDIRFQTIQIINYKSFLDSGEITLDDHFNVIVGKNDAGKSTLLEALTSPQNFKPHRSLLTVPSPSDNNSSPIIIRFSINLTKDDLIGIFSGVESLSYPLDLLDATIDPSPRNIGSRFGAILRNPGKFYVEINSVGTLHAWFKSHERFGHTYHPSSSAKLVTINNQSYPTDFKPILSDDIVPHKERPVPPDYRHIIRGVVYSEISRRIYAFRAERFNLGECKLEGGSDKTLKTDASNLASVLHTLISSNPKRFERFIDYVKIIFPHITTITIPYINHQAQIKIWSIPPNTEREDLAVSLSESGTGVGQVFAILYIIVTADTPKIIMIDEPQSFLHPGAVRKLIDILRQHPQHQYIITTHSPAAIAATGAESLLLVRRQGPESVVEPITTTNKADLNLFLAEVGASLSDVFGADSVLWVEGKTEELCFPKIIRKALGKPLLGMQVLAVHSTADLEGKIATRVFDIYNKLTASTTLLPPALAFLLDREGKSDADISKVDAKSQGLVRWLPRRMYENYLLHAQSLAQVINEDDKDQQKEITEDQVSTWILQNASDDKYFDKGAEKPSYPDPDWVKRVHAAKLLNDLFTNLTECRVTYDKVKHGQRLTDLVIDAKTPDLEELAAFLKEIIEP